MPDPVPADRHETQGGPTRPSERLNRLFEEHCDQIREHGPAGHLAVDSDELSLTYDELDARANQLARYLRLRGADPGDRIALLFDRPTDSYVAMLAVVKIGAAYVRLDAGVPPDRVASILEDARVRTVLSTSSAADRLAQIDLLTTRDTEFVTLDQAAPLIDEMDTRRLIDAERGTLTDQLAYISYASVAGRAEGVAIDHPSICSFVRAAAEVSGIRPRDRVHQGMTTALDFSAGEVWVPWICGATLVPEPSAPKVIGPEQHALPAERRDPAQLTQKARSKLAIAAVEEARGAPPSPLKASDGELTVESWTNWWRIQGLELLESERNRR